jgi:ABC-type uncharacterized transport system substrate-binding protein
VSRIGLLSTSEGIGGYETQLADAQGAAPRLGLSVKPYPAGSRAEIEQALAAMVKDNMEGLVNFQGGLSLFHRRFIIDFVAAHRMPSIFQATLFAEAGGLMAWAPDLVRQYREAARYVDKILRGAKPLAPKPDMRSGSRKPRSSTACHICRPHGTWSWALKASSNRRRGRRLRVSVGHSDIVSR